MGAPIVPLWCDHGFAERFGCQKRLASTMYRGWTDRRAQHRRIARVALPMRFYVSVTGVISLSPMLY